MNHPIKPIFNPAQKQITITTSKEMVRTVVYTAQSRLVESFQALKPH